MLKYTAFVVVLVTVSAEYKFETKWFEVPLDHFGYQRNETFKIKYLVNDTYWTKGGGPIFFYTGNEGQIELFAQHTGFMWDIAEEFQAMIVFAEHRYYGASMPFGNQSLDNQHIGYLTSSQALADYADLLNYLQGNEIRPQYPVIAFGGSYGGMLSAYFRMKYPHVVAGAIAASAPVHMYPGMVPCEAYHRIVTSSFKIANANCVENIRKSWSVIRNFTKNANNSNWLQTEWRLCSPVKNETDVNTLIEFLQSMYETLAMVNYPFPSDFLLPLPGQPVRTVCQFLSQSLTGQKLLEGVGKVLNIFTNYDHNNKCVDYKKGDDYGNLDASGWNYQACTEMVMPMCTTGKDDMFEPSPFNMTTFSEECHKQYNVYPRPEVARIEYGGDRLQAASNIVFSNGLLDPWAGEASHKQYNVCPRHKAARIKCGEDRLQAAHIFVFSNGLLDPWTGGGILNSVSSTVKAVVIIDAAHHLDLMPKNEKDPTSVKMARDIHKQNIREWIREFHVQAEQNGKTRA